MNHMIYLRDEHIEYLIYRTSVVYCTAVVVFLSWTNKRIKNHAHRDSDVKLCKYY